jgi:hypothetical protein
LIKANISVKDQYGAMPVAKAMDARHYYCARLFKFMEEKTNLPPPDETEDEKHDCGWSLLMVAADDTESAPG